MVEQNRNKKIPLDIMSISTFFQWILNGSLICLGLSLCYLLLDEVYFILHTLLFVKGPDFHTFLERILVFFMYFEFIALITKYFKDNYHFPLRYFLYIGITAMIRLIIVNHADPRDTLLFSLAILLLVVAYFIISKIKTRQAK
ncbi:phosphate-starvation-inducible protein PsiE [Aneurinibacillus sp. Ricciae_BoGa-3]|uniref:phosphate-starvation-inducible protein PsiE n=1 Tax=Aneurinibacillus sp. Ricciae_BoGa-3 TaxID=3022697 RepID=UPI002341B4B2|nr:phosphate-starvation-inducible protein PsiE [Aneurinibacillus sp. Ricciae_BoGa-3]WCK56577.1 phosphate-starvation-inducible protein PsiE [Aneurinibacillus sp. Ricciae_BoGa-3]